jgi:hypothetical protein
VVTEREVYEVQSTETSSVSVNDGRVSVRALVGFMDAIIGAVSVLFIKV